MFYLIVFKKVIVKIYPFFDFDIIALKYEEVIIGITITFSVRGFLINF